MHSVATAMNAGKSIALSTALLLALQAPPVLADSFAAIGRMINFSNPPNYCTGGVTAAEQKITRQTQATVGQNVKVVHWAVPCKEREEFRSGTRQYFDHWIQIQVLGTRGEFKPVSAPREQFLASVSKIQPRLDVAELNKRISTAMRDQSMRMDDVGVEVVGRDGNATYLTTRSKLKIGDITRQIRGVAGLTLVNSVPLSVVAYDATNEYKDGNQPQTAMRAVLQSLLTEN